MPPIFIGGIIQHQERDCRVAIRPRIRGWHNQTIWLGYSLVLCSLPDRLRWRMSISQIVFRARRSFCVARVAQGRLDACLAATELRAAACRLIAVHQVSRGVANAQMFVSCFLMLVLPALLAACYPAAGVDILSQPSPAGLATIQPGPTSGAAPAATGAQQRRRLCPPLRPAPHLARPLRPSARP